MTTAPRLTSESPAIIQAVGGSNLAIQAAREQQWEQVGLGGDVLDFGAGAGWLTRRLLDSRRFTRVAAVDLLPRPQGMDAVEWRSEDLNQPTTFVSSSFDTVVASAIIEHVETGERLGARCFACCGQWSRPA